MEAWHSDRALGRLRIIGSRQTILADCWIPCLARSSERPRLLVGSYEVRQQGRLRAHNGSESCREFQRKNGGRVFIRDFFQYGYFPANDAPLHKMLSDIFFE